MPITTLFLDIGGVLLTNAWGRTSRALAAKKFNLDINEVNERHHLCFDTYEMGKLSMDDSFARASDAVARYEEPRKTRASPRWTPERMIRRSGCRWNR